MRYPWLAIILGPLLAALTAPASADALAQLQRFHREVHAVEASFFQVLLDAEGTTLQRSSGKVWLQRPQRFRWDYEEPYPQVVLGDGERVWVYDTELEQVTVKPMEETVSSAPMLVLSGARSLEEDFSAREIGPRDGLEWVELTPKRPEGDFQRVRVGFGGGDLQAMELEDSFGQLSRIRFEDVRINPDIAPERFRLEIPEGVDVVGDAGRR